MELANPALNSKNDSAAILLQDDISKSQIRTIHITLGSFFSLLKENKEPSEEQAEEIWMEQITKIKSTESEKILQCLEKITHRNYVENFALEIAILEPPLEERILYTRLKNLLDKSPRVGLKERVSIVVSEILQILPNKEKESVDLGASQFQSIRTSAMPGFARKLQLYNKKKKEGGGFFSIIFASFGYFGHLASKFNGNHEDQLSHKTYKSYEYDKLEMKEKKEA